MLIDPSLSRAERVSYEVSPSRVLSLEMSPAESMAKSNPLFHTVDPAVLDDRNGEGNDESFPALLLDCPNEEDEHSRTTADLSWADGDSHEGLPRRSSIDSGLGSTASGTVECDVPQAAGGGGGGSGSARRRRSRRRSSIGFDLPTGLERRDSLERRHVELQKSHSDLTDDHRRLELENESLRNAVAKLTQERDVARAQASEWRSVLQDATRNVGRLAGEGRRFEAEAGAFRAERDEAKAECARLREERDKARAVGRRLRKERNALRTARKAERKMRRASLEGIGEVSVAAKSSGKCDAPASSWAEDVDAVHNDSISSFSWLRRLSIGGGGDASTVTVISELSETNDPTTFESSARDPTGSHHNKTDETNNATTSGLPKNEPTGEDACAEDDAPIHREVRGLLGSFRRRTEPDSSTFAEVGTAQSTVSTPAGHGAEGSGGMWPFGRRRQSINREKLGNNCTAVNNRRGSVDGHVSNCNDIEQSTETKQGGHQGEQLLATSVQGEKTSMTDCT